MNFQELNDFLFSITESEQRYLNNEHFQYPFETDSLVKSTLHFKLKEIALNTESKSQYYIRKQSRFTPVPKHTTDVIELNYMYHGCSTHFINDKEISLNKGEIILIDTNASHEVLAPSFDDIVISINISQDFFRDHFFKKMNTKSSLNQFLFQAISTSHHHNQYLLFNGKSSDQLHLLFQQLLCDVFDPTNMSLQFQNLYLQLILLELIRHFSPKSNSADEKGNINQQQLQLEILSYIDKNYLFATLDSAANFFGYNSSYFSTLIKKSFGKGFKELLQKKKIEASLPLLLLSNRSIRDIAEEVGFSNINQYYKCFYKVFNQTPSHYRRINTTDNTKND